MKSYQDRIADFENFKKKYMQEVKNISFEDFEMYFYTHNYFVTNRVPYDNERFYEVLFEIVSNIVKARLQELEYYVNLKPQTHTMQIEAEVISKEAKVFQIQCLKFQIHYKKTHQIGIKNTNNTKESVEYLKQVYDDVKNFQKISSKLQDKLINGFEKQLAELENGKEKKHESSIFS